METFRLDRLLAQQGMGSRKDAGKLIRSGRVSVNGAPCLRVDAQVLPDRDRIEVDGRDVEICGEIYIMLNKRAGTVCARKDNMYATVFDGLGDKYSRFVRNGRLHAVGRLDADTEGLLLLTTDGKLTHRLISPKNHITKTYYIELEHTVSEVAQPDLIRCMAEGIVIAADGADPAYVCRPAELRFLSGSCCTLSITEGRYHQVKRMIASCGNKVVRLRRTAVGGLALDPVLAAGAFRPLLSEELELLR